MARSDGLSADCTSSTRMTTPFAPPSTRDAATFLTTAINAIAAEIAAVAPGFTVTDPFTGPAPSVTETLSMSSTRYAAVRLAAGSFSLSALRTVGSSFSSSFAVTVCWAAAQRLPAWRELTLHPRVYTRATRGVVRPLRPQTRAPDRGARDTRGQDAQSPRWRASLRSPAYRRIGPDASSSSGPGTRAVLPPWMPQR